MPLIIPGERNLTEEFFGALMLGLQENRIREEQREAQEEAADAGGGDLGAAIGTAAGIGAVLLAAPTGGASLVALSAAAAHSAGVGRIAGSLIDPPGKGFPGGQAGQLAQGFNQISQGILRARAIEASEELTEDEKDEAYLQGLSDDFGPEAVAGFTKSFDEFMASAKARGLPEPSRSDFRVAHRQAMAGQFAQIARETKAGLAGARGIGKDEAKKLFDYRQNVDNPNSLFKMTPQDMQGHEALLLQKKNIDDKLAAGKITPENALQFRRQLRAQERDFVRPLIRRPPAPQSMEQLMASGGQMVPFQVYTIGDPKTATEGRVSTGRSVNSVPIRSRGGIVESKDFPGVFENVDDEGKKTFAGRRIADGTLVPQGVPYEHSVLGWGVDNDKGKFELYKEKGGNTTADAVRDTVEALLKQTDNFGESVILQKMQPKEGETPEDARRRVATTISNLVGAQMDAEQLVERQVEVASFARQWRGAPDFATVYNGLLGGDDEFKQLDGVLQQLNDLESSGPLPPRGAAIRRGVAKRILFKLQGLELEFSRLSPAVRDGYIRAVAQLTNIANGQTGGLRVAPSGAAPQPDINLSPQ